MKTQNLKIKIIKISLLETILNKKMDGNSDYFQNMILILLILKKMIVVVGSKGYLGSKVTKILKKFY